MVSYICSGCQSCWVCITGLGLYLSYHQVSPELKELRETVKQMEADGASDEDILAFMDQDKVVDERKLQDSPGWMVLTTTVGIVASFVLFLPAVMSRIG